MRCLFLIVALSLTSLSGWADTVSAPSETAPDAAAQFQLGGSATRNAPFFREGLRLPERGVQDQSLLTASRSAKAESPLSAAASDDHDAPYFLDEIAARGSEVFSTSAIDPNHLRAHFSDTSRHTWRPDLDRNLLNTETFLDIILSESITLGLSSIRDTAGPADAAPARQLGLSAEFSTSGGAYLQGGVADANALEPVFGFSLGLRF